jgi:hypothetical protein
VADRKEIVRALVERVTVTVRGNTEHAAVRIQWIGGTSTEHAFRRPISRYERLADFPRMRSLVEAAVAAGQTAEQIAERLNREGFRPASNPAKRFTPARARDLVYRLGLSPRPRPAVRLSADEWWACDLADELGVSYCRFKGWVEKGYVHVRKVGKRFVKYRALHARRWDGERARRKAPAEMAGAVIATGGCRQHRLASGPAITRPDPSP